MKHTCIPRLNYSSSSQASRRSATNSMLVTLIYAAFAAGGDAPAASTAAGCESPTAASTAAGRESPTAASTAAGRDSPTAASTAAGRDSPTAASTAAGREAPAPFDYRGWISMAVADVISTTMGFLFKFWLISSFLTVRLHLPPPPLSPSPPHPTCRRIKGTWVTL